MTGAAGGTIPGVSGHARRRMAERHGRDLTGPEWAAVRAAILDGRGAALLLRQPDGVALYAVALGGLVLRVVWRPADGTVVTVLPDGSPSTIPASESARAARLRRSFTMRAHHRAGRRLGARTVWAP